MNGLLTALLGGASGVGQGLQYQDEREMKLREQRMGRLGLASQLISQGITPPDWLTAEGESPSSNQPSAPAQPQQASAPAPDMPSGAPQVPQVPQGTLTQLLTPRVRTRGGFSGGVPVQPMQPPSDQSQAPQSPTPSTTPSAQPGGVSAIDIMRGLNNPQQVGGMTYNPGQSLAARTMMMGVVGDQLKRRNDTDERIRESAATGATAKNLREVNTPRLGDPDYPKYMAQVAGAEAAAKLPFETQKMVTEGKISRENGIALEQIRAGVQAQLQNNQHQFELGKLSADQKFAADQQARSMAGSFFNSLGLKEFEAGGHPMESFFRSHADNVPRNGVAPSQQIAPVGGSQPTATPGKSVLDKYGIQPTRSY